jgi:2-deoxy-D-gluconate 3-dehydrogenase
MSQTNLPDLFRLDGRVALVTGGAGLLGVEFCRTLAEAGAHVVAADLNGAVAERTVRDLGSPHGRHLAVTVDVTSPASVQVMVEGVLQTFGRLDVLVNSAALDPKFDHGLDHGLRGFHGLHREGDGTTDETTDETPEDVKEGMTNGRWMGVDGGYGEYGLDAFEDYPLEAWNQALAVNLTGAFLCCQAVAKPMLAQGGGVIINLSSIYGLAAPDQRMYQRPGQPPRFKPVYYTVTKTGILGLTIYLAAYYAGKNIRVNALSPGGVYNGHDEVFVQAYSARAVMGRMAEKYEMNGALLFLASDASKYMTGANLVVDGGWTVW